MNINIINWMNQTRGFLPDKLGKVLDVGSLNVNGSAREVYTDAEQYIGIDMRAGKDVDVVMNGHDISITFEKESFDVVVCMNTLEHDDKFWLTLGGINSVLKKGGYLVFCVPTFYFPIHYHPKDYWRMEEQAVREVVFDGYELLDLKEVFTKELEGKNINPVICAIGKKL